jgi:type I restriction enzyme S subunit
MLKLRWASIWPAKDRTCLILSQFLKLDVFIPDIETQKKIAIASILNQAESEIQLRQSQLQALQEQKKGLMQQLLTGKVRVKP